MGPLADNPHLEYRPDIDGLRTVAIVAVVLFHAFPAWVSGGFVGVDVFFVISGYLITGLILKGLLWEASGEGRFSFRRFYANRVFRIFPALIVVLLACLVFGWFFLLADEYKQLGKQVVGGAAFVENILLWNEAGYFDTQAELKPLLHLWSLGIEEQFYLAWPLLLVGPVRRRLDPVLLILGVAAMSFIANVMVVKGDASAAFYSPMTRMWELMSGGLLAYYNLSKLDAARNWRNGFTSRVPMRNPVRIDRDVKSFAGVLLILAGVLVLDKTAAFPGWWALLPTLGACLLISAGPDAWINRRVLASRPFVFVGLVSYPLYLWHWPLLAFARILQGGTPSPTVRAGAVAAAFILSCLTYWLVEKTLRVRRHWTVLLGMCFTLSVLAGGGYNIFEREGLEFRLKDSELQRVKFGVTLHYQTQCRRDFKFAESSLCMRGSEDRPPTVALIGDSHALNLYPGLGDYFHRHGGNLVLFGAGGGVPYFGIERVVNGQLTDSYAKLYASIFDYVSHEQSIETVILASKAVWSNGERYALKYDLDPANSDTLDIYGKAMARTLKALLAAHKEVVIVIDNPMLDFDPGTCIPRPSSQVPARTPCALPREQYEREMRLYRKKTEEILARFPEVKRWDLAKQLCDDRYCWAIRDDKMFYARDGHHLTVAGSYWLAERFKPE
jgi:peptidoglycan/LPS O-acetylase OafA/YrhL